MTPRVRVVVLNYNGGDDTLACFDALARTHWPAEALDLVCVDNASVDGSIERLAERHPQVRIVRSPRNAGFPANNLGLVDREGVDHLALINNDLFVGPDWLAPLVQALDAHPEWGAVQPLIVFDDLFVDVDVRATAPVLITGVYTDGRATIDRCRVSGEARPVRTRRGRGWLVDGRARISVPADARDETLGDVEVDVTIEVEALGDADVVAACADADAPGATVRLAPGAASTVRLTVSSPAGTLVNNAGIELLPDGYARDAQFGVPLERMGTDGAEREVFACSGAAVLFRRQYLDEIGLLDEGLFLYCEDLELCWRGRPRGWRFGLVPSAVVRHRHSATVGTGSRLHRFWSERNRLVVLVRHAPARTAIRAVVRFPLSTASLLRQEMGDARRWRRAPDLATTADRVRAYGSFLAAAPGALAKRRRRA